MPCGHLTMDNSKYIDLWHSKNGYGSPPAQDPEWKAAMAKIRRTRICVRCDRYPGDKQYTLGLMDERGAFTCFECLK